MRRILAFALVLCLLAGCSPGQKPSAEIPAAPQIKPVELSVVTTYGIDDGNRSNYVRYVRQYEEASGNTVLDFSGTANEEWKARVMADFEAGAEPDILFYWTGVDSDKIVGGGKVVPIGEIRAVYPDYGSNMQDAMLPVAPADGKKYAIPANGFWEALYVNKKVLADCRVEIPGRLTTWERFMRDCETIHQKGYVPIAASLREVPHYWFEFCVLNHTTVEEHVLLPASPADATGRAWAGGLRDIKEMYDKGFFPDNTTTATDPETNQLMLDGRAAFMVDGSWKLGWFLDNAENIDDFTVTYVPAKGERKPTDIIGGISSGYFITRKAWDDPEKRQACVEFVSAMTTDEAVREFGVANITALKSEPPPLDDTRGIVLAAARMANNATGMAASAGDSFYPEARGEFFGNVTNIVTGAVSTEQAIRRALMLNE
jgi:raffinose/stachyose/melibiose transport system substrate-binding protein